ncbi:MAG TPA: isoprenoid biosynthesis glyoxalase ElbB [Pseudomonadales bacterium]|nr:isoprenoid biosynthesis glyoxalase ElbB [Pseudomonadales bacterium]
MTKVAVILAGCGVFDGGEIHESTLTLLALDQAGASYQCLAPDIKQMHVVNHLTGEEMAEQRNVLLESARIARGKVLDISKANPLDYDAVIVPGGFGVAKNLCDFAVKGSDMTVNSAVQAFIRAVHEAGRPVGLVCIAPVMAPRLFGKGVLCTIGRDAGTASAIESMGGQHQACAVDGVVVDKANRLVTTPAYMLAERISEVAASINNLVKAVLEMTR